MHWESFSPQLLLPCSNLAMYNMMQHRLRWFLLFFFSFIWGNLHMSACVIPKWHPFKTLFHVTEKMRGSFGPSTSTKWHPLPHELVAKINVLWAMVIGCAWLSHSSCHVNHHCVPHRIPNLNPTQNMCMTRCCRFPWLSSHVIYDCIQDPIKLLFICHMIGRLLVMCKLSSLVICLKT